MVCEGTDRPVYLCWDGMVALYGGVAWPCLSKPQHAMVPLVFTPQVCADPAST